MESPSPGRRPPGEPITVRLTKVTMLATIAIVLLVLWLVGTVSATTVGGLVHVLLVVALVIVLLRVIQGRRALGGI